MVVQHNLQGMNANRQLNITTGIQAKSSEKLSSGYKINRAADDAAGLAISEKMRRQIRGLSQASNNAQDGVSWCQIADGALDEVSNMASRAKELAVQAANDTLTDDDRSYINEEMQKMKAEIDRTHASTEFNNIHIFADDGFAPGSATKSDSSNKMTITLPNGADVEISVNFIGADGKMDKVDSTKAVGQNTTYSDSAFAKYVQDAAASAIGKLYSNFPTLFSTASSEGIEVGLDLHRGEKGGVLASAAIKMSTGSSSTMMTYSMYVDTIDYPVSDFATMSDSKKADLAATIAHEMTHLIMYDTLTDGMFGNFPKWFVEGAAQTSSGDGGWVTLTPSSSDAAIKSYNAKLTDGNNAYGAGYIATMYLGYAVSASDSANPNTDVTSDNIKAGLDKLMSYMAGNKKTLNEAIADLTGYSGRSDFESSFMNSTAKSSVLDPLAFTKSFLQARETNGEGSLFGKLSDSQLDVFAPDKLNPTGTNYTIKADSTWYANAFGSGYVFPEKEDGTATGDGTSDGLGKTLKLQVGSETESMNQIDLKRFDIRLSALSEGKTFDTSTRELALETIETVNVIGLNVASVRSYYGALQNRLEHTIKNLDNVVENTSASESRIRDTDMAAEMVRFSNNNILAQAGQAMLAQANQTNQGVLSLLQ